MAKYRVNWSQEVIQIWTGTVEANSEEEAMEQLKEGSIHNEELVDEEDRSVSNEQVEGLEEDGA